MKRTIVIAVLAIAAIALAIVRPNVPRLALEVARHLFGARVDQDLHVQQHDIAIAHAAAHRDSAKAIAELLDTGVVRPALNRDSATRQELRRVLAADTTVPLDVDSLQHALHVTTVAAAQLDTSSTRAIGSLLALVAAKSAQAEASDTLAARTQTALLEERRDRARERWVYRAKIAGGILAGVILGALAAHVR